MLAGLHFQRNSQTWILFFIFIFWIICQIITPVVLWKVATFLAWIRQITQKGKFLKNTPEVKTILHKQGSCLSWQLWGCHMGDILWWWWPYISGRWLGSRTSFLITHQQKASPVPLPRGFRSATGKASKTNLTQHWDRKEECVRYF